MYFPGELSLCGNIAPHGQETTLSQFSKRKQNKDKSWKFGCNRKYSP